MWIAVVLQTWEQQIHAHVDYAITAWFFSPTRVYIQPHATQAGANHSTQIPNAHSIPADRILWLLADHFKRLISEPYSDLTLTRRGRQGNPELYSSTSSCLANAYSLTRLFSQPRGVCCEYGKRLCSSSQWEIWEKQSSIISSSRAIILPSTSWSKASKHLISSSRASVRHCFAWSSK